MVNSVPTRSEPVRDPEGTRAALLDAATELFARRGFSGAKTEEIARLAGVNKAMINYHFGGKLGLYQEVLATLFAQSSARLLELLDEGEKERCDVLLRRFVEILAEGFASRPMLPSLALREAMAGAKNVDERALPHMGVIHTVLEEIIRRGVDEGVFRPVNSRAAHTSIMGTLIYFLAVEPYRRRLVATGHHRARLSLEEMVHHIQEVMVRGLTAEGGSGPDREDR